MSSLNDCGDSASAPPESDPIRWRVQASDTTAMMDAATIIGR